MSQLELEEYANLLKEDLVSIGKLNTVEKSIHLREISKPLLHKLFQVLGNGDGEDEDNNVDVSTICHYLMEYLVFDDDLSVEATMGLYRIKQFNKSFNIAITENINNLIDLQETKYEKYKIFIILTNIFTIDSFLASEIFTKNQSFISLLTNEITFINDEIESLNNLQSIKNINKLLKLFSNACIDEMSRSIIATVYINLIIKCLRLSNNIENHLQTKCYAATITIKLWRLIKPEVLEDNSTLLSLNNLLEIILLSIKLELFTSIEGLSLLVTNIQIRGKIRNNDELLNKLFKLLNNHHHTTYGIISILSFLTIPNRILKIQQSSMMNLKDSNSISNYDIYTNAKINNSKKFDDINDITLLIDKLVKIKFFSQNMVKIFKSIESSKGLIGECLKLMNNVIFPDIVINENETIENINQNYIVEIKQIIKLLTTYLIGTSQNIKYNHKTFIHLTDETNQLSEKDLEYRLLAIKSLSSPKISEMVNLLFDDENKDEEITLSIALFLLEIIVQADIDNGTALTDIKTPFSNLKKNGQIFTSFDIYYAYIGLSAICSLNFNKINETVFLFGFKSIINMITSDNDKLQFSSLKLLNEICLLPLCIAKLFNWSSMNNNDENFQNFKILNYLINSNNIDSQICVLQIFAKVSNYSIVSEKLISNEKFCNNLNDVLVNQYQLDELIYYSLDILSNLFQSNSSTSYLSVFKNSKNSILQFQKSDNEQIRESVNSITKYL
ncbi:hypothetical protein DAPK24_000310 [Pichia kluyveri]|uniref:UNC-45/Cro1/She4 central domain-containing protein n=1 Tax=Pichia kluyveri TaxID=36015 RepID=A0AAV5QW07_PICKL|nr:hypothetical protein DAPK24_000310 [Pichia kluyveri]